MTAFQPHPKGHLVSLQLPHRRQDFVQRFVEYGLTQASNLYTRRKLADPAINCDGSSAVRDRNLGFLSARPFGP